MLNRWKFQFFGGSWSHTLGMSFAKASIAAITNSEMATPLAPRAHVTVRPSNNSAGNPSTPVPESCTQGTVRTHGAIRSHPPQPPNITSALNPGGGGSAVNSMISASGKSRKTASAAHNPIGFTTRNGAAWPGAY